MPPNTSTELRTSRAFLSACRLAFRVSPLTFLAIVVLGLVGGSVLAPATIAGKSLINELTSPQRGQHLSTIVLLAITASALTALGSAAIYLAGIPAYRLAARVQLETETQLATACGRFPGVDPLEDAAMQDRLALAQRGAHEAPELVTSTITQFLTTSSRIATFVGAVWEAFPPMVVALLLSAAPLALLQRRIQLRSIFYNEQANVAYRWRDYFSQLFVTPATAREMRLYGAQEMLAGRLRARLAEALTSEVRRSTRIALAQLGYAGINAIVAGAGATWVAVEIAHGRLSVGDFLLFTGAVVAVQAALQGLFTSLGSVGSSAAVFHHYLALIELSQVAERAGGTAETPPLTDGVEFRDVWFRYPGSPDWVLKGLDLWIPPRQLTVLVGLNGAGKSSIINLLLRFYHPQRGSIRWNGVDIGSLRPAGLRGRICGVLQEPGCYELTAMGNLVLGNGGRPVELAVAREAAQQANVLEAIERLPRGFDTLLSTRRADEEGSTGVTLSGGEWQRLALGRALIGRDRDLLVLDEANSRLDVAADSVLNTLLTGLRDVTRLVVTHRMDTVRLADLIYVIEDGTAVEAGGYQELLARGGVLATLASTQESTPASTVG